MAKLAAFQAEVDTRSGSIGKLPGPEKRWRSPTRPTSSTPSKRSKPAVAGHPSSSPKLLPPSSDVPSGKGKEVVPAIRLPPPLTASRDQEAQPFVPAPRAKSCSVQVSDSGLKDRDVAIGLIQSVILEKDKALAGDITASEAGSILQSMAYQVHLISL
ncbi:hypothetical protein QJS04_geneDACA012697 [Acorus gramineus]|uniref:Uncharacterized protein n=1 Tax=Acorus gramineus TaxID=55184 RepID=A0AAV9B4P6_ACOGR|nr:hypothetical protein QJS04_geneDACA012697 [Acorus gramineus]